MFAGFGEAFARMALVLGEVQAASWSPWSPDGRSLIWTDPLDGHTGERPPDWRQGNLVRLSLDGEAPRVLAEGSYLAPAWSPDGRWIACVSMERGAEGPTRSSLWLFSADGQERRELFTGWGWHLLTPTWSPDGQWIAFASDGLELVRPDGSEHRWLGPGWLPAWSPDGTRLACVHEGGVELVTPDGARTRIADQPSLGVSWSPDGRRLALDALDEGDGTRRNVVLVDSDGGPRRVLCPGMFPVWSPRGDRILVVRAWVELWSVSVETGEERWLAQGQLARWSPDGSRVAFARGEGVVVVDADGGGERVVRGATE